MTSAFAFSRSVSAVTTSFRYYWCERSFAEDGSFSDHYDRQGGLTTDYRSGNFASADNRTGSAPFLRDRPVDTFISSTTPPTTGILLSTLSSWAAILPDRVMAALRAKFHFFDHGPLMQGVRKEEGGLPWESGYLLYMRIADAQMAVRMDRE